MYMFIFSKLFLSYFKQCLWFHVQRLALKRNGNLLRIALICLQHCEITAFLDFSLFKSLLKNGGNNPNKFECMKMNPDAIYKTNYARLNKASTFPLKANIQ